jgi:hypothetical protein
MRYSTILLLLFIPFFAFSAGFAKGSLFLSHSGVVEGETVRIYAVVSNDSSEALSAEVVFSEGEETLGTAPVNLAAGGATAVSVAWKPTAGKHTVTASFSTKDGTQKESATFVIKEIPKPEKEVLGASVESSEDIQKLLYTYVPSSSALLTPIFSFFDSVRQKGAGALEPQIESAKAKLDTSPKPGLIAGKETTNTSSPVSMDTFWFVLYTLYLYLLTIISYILKNAGIFYPALVILFFLVLWKILRRIRRPAY